MAWFQNLAGKAEDFLNKIDQNAATVLNESTTTSLEVQVDIENTNVIEPMKPSPVLSQSSIIEMVDETEAIPQKTPTKIFTEDTSSPYVTPRQSSSPVIVEDFGVFERPLRTESAVLSSKASSYNLLEEQARYEEQINRLELENQDLNKQILNLQHLYSELQNEHGNLKLDNERATESAQEAQTQMEQYKVRAQRMLHEKEKLCQVKPSNSDEADAQTHILTNYIEELKKELQFQQERNAELNIKINDLNKELVFLQQQYVAVQNSNQQSSQNLHQTLVNERKLRANVEEELRMKTKELQGIKIELIGQQNSMKSQELEILKLKEKIKHSSTVRGSEDVESRLQVLTQTLMLKQNTLETITSERNALKIQLEKLEITYNQLLNQRQRALVNMPGTNDTDDVSDKSQVPRLLQVSPLDAGVTRRVKHAYSTLDTISIRTGAFLRRYPVARVFVFCYMILLHIWVIIILFTYVPSGR